MVQNTCLEELKPLKNSRCFLSQPSRRRRNRMQQRRRLQYKATKETEKKEEMRCLYSELGAVIPSCKNQPTTSGIDVVLKAVDYINQLHQQVEAEHGVIALQEIQQNARKVVLQQLKKMNGDTKQVNISVR